MLTNEQKFQKLKSGLTFTDILTENEIKLLKLSKPTLGHRVGVELEFMSIFSTVELLEVIKQNTDIEVQAVSRSSRDYSSWTRKPDGSIHIGTEGMLYLRGLMGVKPNNNPSPYAWALHSPINVYGHEIVSPILNNSNIGELKQMLDTLNLKVPNMNLPVGFTNSTCGLHINIDTTNYTEAQKESVYNLFKTIEPELASLVPTERNNNDTCKPVIGITYNERLRRDKYHSVHVKPQFNIFEYRKFYMTKNWYKVINIIYLLDQIHSYGKTHKVPYTGSFSLYNCTENPILWDFISLQKKEVKQNKQKLLTDWSFNINTSVAQPKKREEKIPVIMF